MNVTWHWPKFIRAIETDPELQRVTHSATERLNLSWCVDAWEHEAFGTDVNYVFNVDPVAALLWKGKRPESVEQISWLDFVHRLKEIVSERACELFLTASTAKSEAVADGLHLAGRAAQVYAALLPLYYAGTGRAKA
jgi:hypothetical protein